MVYGWFVAGFISVEIKTIGRFESVKVCEETLAAVSSEKIQTKSTDLKILWFILFTLAYDKYINNSQRLHLMALLRPA